MQPFQRIRTVQVPLVLERQVPVREDVLGRVLEQRGGLRKPAAQPVSTFRSCVIAVA